MGGPDASFRRFDMFEQVNNDYPHASLFVVLIAVLVSVGAVGCAEGSTCSSDSDCPSGEACVAGGGVLFGESACIPRAILEGDAVSGDVETDGGVCSTGPRSGRPNPSFDLADCEQTNGGVETCDGVDNDCDGRIDECVAETACSLTEGVCAGTTINECTGNRYATCGAETYGEDYTSADNEGWRCDDLDNDCDGTVDEWCCDGSLQAADRPFSPKRVAQIDPPSGTRPYDGPIRPAVAPVLPDAPDAAAALVAWHAGTGDIELQYVDRSGETINSPVGVTVGGVFAVRDETIYRDISGISLVRGNGAYHLIIARATLRASTDSISHEASSIRLHTFSPGLNGTGSSSLTTPTQIVSRLAAAFHNGSIFLTSVVHDGFESVHSADVRLQRFDPEKVGTFESLSLPAIVEDNLYAPGLKPSRLFARPMLRAHPDAGVAAAWMTGGSASEDAQINLVTLDDSGAVTGVAATDRPEPTGGADAPTGYVDVLWRAPRRLDVVFDIGDGLTMVSVDPRAGSVEAPAELTADGRAPSVHPVRGPDGFATDATIVWNTTGETGDETRSAKLTTGDSVDMSTPVTLRRNVNVVEPPRLIDVSDGVGALWSELPGSGEVYALYGTLSHAGRGICSPDSM